MGALHPLQRRLLAEDFVRLRRADEQRRYAASLRRGRIDPNPHQIDAVVFALRRIPEGGCILADEVGLGKTIEAGLIIAQLLTEGKRRILLIVPKSLLGQWQAELYDLFGIEAREGRHDPEAFAGPGVFLVHREYAGAKGASLLSSVNESEPFDLVVIDEAHEFFASIYKRFDGEGNYKTGSDDAQIADQVRSLVRKSGTPILLLTATPIQNSLTELWGLVQFVEPTNALLGKLPTFREVFCAKEGKDRSLVEGQEGELRRRLSAVLQRTLRSQAKQFLAIPFVDRQTRVIEYAMSPREKELYDAVTAWLMQPNLYSFRSTGPLLIIAFHRRMASSLAALAASLEAVAERLRNRLSSLGVSFTDGLEADFAEDLEEDYEDVDVSLAEEQPEPLPEDRVRAELKLVEGFIERAKSIGRESKAACLLQALDLIRERGVTGEGTGKVVIFTESLRTQDFLRELLTGNGFQPGEITLFRGHNEGPRVDEALKRWEEEVGRKIPADNRPTLAVAIRLALVHEFKTRSKVFISTEAGAKGLNLQFCESLVNYDLPWNPQRVEQRIGRVHRYRQQRGVLIWSFLDRENEAQRLTFDILSKKLDLFGKVLGAADEVLPTGGPDGQFPEPLVWGLGLDFEQQLRRIYGQARTLDEVIRELNHLRDEMDTKRKEFDAEHARTAQLIETRLTDAVRQTFEKYQRELPSSLKELDRELERIVSAYLTAESVVFTRSESDGRIVFNIYPSSKLPQTCQEGGTFLVGPARDLGQGELLHSGHPLVAAAVDEARRATTDILHVELHSGNSGLSPNLGALAGRRGRLVVTKVLYRGLESAEHLLVTAMIENQEEPVPLSIADLMAMLIRDNTKLANRPEVDEDGFAHAIQEALLDDQFEVAEKEHEQFVRRLDQLDRYLEDQILVLSKKRAIQQRKIEEAERKMAAAAAPAAQAQWAKQMQMHQSAIQGLEERIERLRQGDDPDYQLWRESLYVRRYQKPTTERILEVDFRIAERATAC
jgi:hypothetical protein